MKIRALYIFFVLLFATTSMLVFESCKNSKGEFPKEIIVDPSFREFVDGFTSGPVSTESGVIVRLNFDYADTSMYNKPADPNLFSFKPGIKGTAYWVDARTVRFQPAEKLPANTFFEASFNLDKLVDVPDSMKTMVFSFQTITQDFEVFTEQSRAYSSSNLSKERLTGYVLTADAEDAEKIKTVIKAEQNGKTLPLSWSQSDDKRKHVFTIDSIQRGRSASEVVISYNGKDIGVDKKGQIQYTIHGINEFKVKGLETKRYPDEVIILYFTDPIKEDQEIDGLISMGSFFNYSYTINFNELHVFPASEIEADEYINVSSGIMNINGKKMDKPYSQLVKFENIGPDVRFISDGVILPSTNGLIIPFEAVNLKAVDVKVIQIFQSNIPQFLQVNELKGQSQMKRVGRTVLKKTISLGQVANPNKWNRFFLDLSELIKTEPGAIYSVELSIRPELSAFPCAEIEQSENEVFKYFNEVSDADDDNWEYSGYYYDDYYWYDWSEREDPCSRAYYSGKKAQTNILATDIGLMAKHGENGDLYIFATNIVTAKPMSDVSINILNYQQQSVFTAKTDEEGKCIINTKNQPFLIIASKDNQQSYLKLGSGNSLSLSTFDVSGERVQGGMKGFIYGERGVWRPGDSLYLTLMLEDNLKILPVDHPVIFELYNPMGNIIEKRTVTKSVHGFYPFRTATSPDAPTGNYKVIARVGNNSFVQNLKIEAIKPNRLKIDVDPGTTFLSIKNPSDFKIHSQWLHGATAKDLKVESDVTFKSVKTKFDKYPDFVFDDPTRSFTSDQMSFFSGKLDENGNVSFKPELKIEKSPGFLAANIETRVYEPGGDFSIDFLSINVSPYSSYVGLKAPAPQGDAPYFYTERNYTFNIINILENGKMSSSPNVNIEVYKLEWRYWWNSYDDNSDFISTQNSQSIDKSEIKMKNGTGTYSLKVNNSDWGKYYIKVTDPVSGHVAGQLVYFDWYGYNRFPDKDKTAAAMLTINTDKTSYFTGEEIKLSFQAPKGSRAYVSIENGMGVIETHQIIERDNMIEFKTKATAQMAPNVYFSVSLIQPHSNTVDGLPIRMYGVVPVFVENPETKLLPVIQTTDVYRPGETATIRVSESKGKPMTYTLAIVDEGLLSLTKYKTPDPHSRFYSREALGVKTWDIFDDVIGAYGIQMQRILSVGGGDDVEVDPTGQRANRFKPMVRFIGPVELEAGKINTHSIEIPDYIGAARIMVVAGQDKAYGNAEKTVQVRSPLMLLGTAPRVIGPDETFRVPVSVFAMEDDVKNVQVSIQTNNMLSVTGAANQTLNFAKTGEQLTGFDLKAANTIGMGTITIVATSGSRRAVWSIEMDVRPSNPEITTIIAGTVKEGETWSADINSIGIPGTNGNILEVSSFIPMNIDKWLNYLVNYPHGCTEQTISGAFPLLYAEILSDASESGLKRADAKIRFAISRIQQLQLGSGGIAMWPGSRYPDDWTTSYAGHFAIEAQQKGYVISKQFLKKWKSYQQNKVKKWKHDKTVYNNDLMQAYRLYTLALAGSPEVGAMNKLAEQSYLTPQTKWMLASAYAITGRTDAAKRLIAKATTQIINYFEYGYTYGSHIRDKAFILETYLRLGMNNNSLEMLTEIAQDLSSNYWLSTQTAGQSLRVVGMYLSQYPMGKQMDFTLTDHSGSKNIQSKNMTHTTDLGDREGHRITIKNTNAGTIYVRVIQKGIPKESDVPSAENNLKMEVSYKNLQEKSIDPTSIPQGTIFFAHVTVTHPGQLNKYQSMALTQIFPSGWEVLSDRYVFEDDIYSIYTYQDIRDDRVITYFDLDKSKSITISVRLSASYVGKFYMPMVYCEAMYNNHVNASLAGKWVEVTEP